jgi:hypothetical protein
MQETTAGHAWPPGVYRGDDGKLYRDIPRLVERLADPDTGEMLETHEYRPVEVMVPTASDGAGILAEQRRAKMAGLDFYRPGIGWLRRGARREVDRPENRGAEMTPRRRETRRVTSDDQTPPAPAAPPAARSAPLRRAVLAAPDKEN